jgi:electron transfer flavoprotein beta subunit
MDDRTQIVVCVKAVVLKPPKGKKMDRTAENSVLNPYDRSAISAAVELAASQGKTVTALSMGPPQTEGVLFEALAMGADRAVLACDRAMAGSDTLATARVLSAAIGKLDRQSPVSWVMLGMRSADSDTGQVGPQTAALLKWPMVANVDRISPHTEEAVLQRCLDGFMETLRVRSPAVLGISPQLIENRDIDLGAIGAVYEGQTIEHWDLAKLGVSVELVGDLGSPTRVNTFSRRLRRHECRWIEGDCDHQARRLLNDLTQAGLLE